MSVRLVDAGSRFLASRTSRRGFLRNAALVGSALATTPMAYALRPVTAYSAICSCSGSSCDCSALCCDGYTEFCCTLYGSNSCPPGTLAAGWWKADVSGFCVEDGVDLPRYYIDCNVDNCGSCGCGSSGSCGSGCVGLCDCGCGAGSCDNRKACCAAFRYGQCNQDVACVGPIVCRVVTCTPPWEIDDSCTTTVATDNNTRFHDRPCLHAPPPLMARPAVVNGNTWRLRNSLTDGGANRKFEYGIIGDHPVMGDWTASGTATAGIVRGARFGRLSDTALVWLLRSEQGDGEPDIAFEYGRIGDIPVVGDWLGDGRDLPGVVRGGSWMLRTSLESGPPDIEFEFGGSDGIPVVGDWDDTGGDSPGLYRDGEWLLRDSLSSGTADRIFTFGTSAGIPVVGDWNGDGTDGIGVFNSGSWRLRQTPTGGGSQITFDFGPSDGTPLVWGVS